MPNVVDVVLVAVSSNPLIEKLEMREKDIGKNYKWEFINYTSQVILNMI